VAQRRGESFRIQSTAHLTWEFQALDKLLEDVVDRLFALSHGEVELAQIPRTPLGQLVGTIDSVALALVGRRDGSGAWLTVEVVHTLESG